MLRAGEEVRNQLETLTTSFLLLHGTADRLANLDVELDLDTLLVGDDADAVATVRTLADQIEGLRALNAGGLANAAEVESLTPLLINIAMENEGMHDVGVQFE